MLRYEIDLNPLVVKTFDESFTTIIHNTQKEIGGHFDVNQCYSQQA